MKKILAILLATLMLLSLAACGEKAPAADTGKPEDTQQSEQTQSENTTTAASETEEKSDNENASVSTPSVREFKSNDKQCVIYLNNAYVVYGLDGNDIISCTSYTEFDTVDIAKAAYEESVEEIKKDPDVTDCRLDGNVIVCEYAENAWAGRDKTMLETVFADKLVK